MIAFLAKHQNDPEMYCNFICSFKVLNFFELYISEHNQLIGIGILAMLSRRFGI